MSTQKSGQNHVKAFLNTDSQDIQTSRGFINPLTSAYFPSSEALWSKLYKSNVLKSAAFVVVVLSFALLSVSREGERREDS